MVSRLITLVGALLYASYALAAPSNDNIRPLKAAKRSLRNEVRDNAIFRPSTQLRLDYVDGMIATEILDVVDYLLTHTSEGTIDSSAVFGATLHVGTKKPTVVLEHVEHMISEISCSPAGIFLNFSSESAAVNAAKSWTMSEFVVVTSSPSCNNDGERVPYMYV